MGRCLGTGQFLNRDIKKVALLDSVFLFILALDENTAGKATDGWRKTKLKEENT